MTPIPAKIVIVDDHRRVRQTLRAVLARAPHWRVYDVESGALALDLIRQIHPHVALLDLVMPEMNGVELAIEIRQLENAPKIVLMTATTLPRKPWFSRVFLVTGISSRNPRPEFR